MPAPANDTAKIVAEIQASETRTATRIQESEARVMAKLDQQTATLQASIEGISTGGGTPADNSEVLAAIAKVDADLAAVAQDVKDIEALVSAAPPAGGGGGDTRPSPGNDTQPTFGPSDGTTGGLVTTFGTGPDVIALSIDSGPNATDPIVSFGLYQMSGPAGAPLKHVAAAIPVPLRSAGSAKPGQVFEFHVDYGGTAPFLYLTEENELRNCYVKGVTFNGFPYECPDTADKDHPGVSLTKWDNNGIPLHWNPQGTAQSGGGDTGGGGPAPTETPATLIVTATDGTTRTLGPDLLKNIASQVKVSEVAELQNDIKSPGATFSANCTFKGKDGGRTKIDATGFPQASFPGNGKAVLLAAAGTSAFTFANLEIFGAHIPSTAGANIAAIGEKTLGTVTANIENCYIHDCDDGIATGVGNRDANTILEKCGGDHPPQPTHNSYTKEEAGEQTINGGASLSALTGYVEKTRCQSGTITGTRYVIDQSGGGGINLARGGVHRLDGLKIKHLSTVADHKIISFGTETPTITPAANELHATNCEIDADGAQVIIQNGTIFPDASVDVTGMNVISGNVQLKGWKAANVTPSPLPADVALA